MTDLGRFRLWSHNERKILTPVRVGIEIGVGSCESKRLEFNWNGDEWKSES